MSLLLLLRKASIKYHAGRAVEYRDKLKAPDNTFLKYIYPLYNALFAIDRPLILIVKK